MHELSQPSMPPRSPTPWPPSPPSVPSTLACHHDPHTSCCTTSPILTHRDHVSTCTMMHTYTHSPTGTPPLACHPINPSMPPSSLHHPAIYPCPLPPSQPQHTSSPGVPSHHPCHSSPSQLEACRTSCACKWPPWLAHHLAHPCTSHSP